MLRLVYATMLGMFSPQKVLEFWLSHPLPGHSGAIERKPLFELLWEERQSVPLEWEIDVLNSVEPFLTDNGVKLQAFVDAMLCLLNNGSIRSAGELLEAGKPILDRLLVDEDTRPLLLENIHLFQKEFTPDSPLILISHQERAGFMHGVVLLAYHRSCGDQIPAYDPEIWTAPIIRISPMGFGAQPYESTSILADRRSVEQVIGSLGHRGDNGVLTIGGHVYGSTCSLYSFGEHHQLDLAGAGIPDRDVVLVERDYYCEKRGRVVLHEGTVYGAPVYLFSVIYRKAAAHRRNFLVKLVRDFVGGDRGTWKRADRQHRNLIEVCDRSLEFVFYRNDCQLTVDDRYLVRGVPARILSRILAAHTTGGRTDFTNKEFLTDRDVITEPSNPNLAIRLKRIAQTLREKCPVARIVRVSRGKFAFEADCSIRYRETD